MPEMLGYYGGVVAHPPGPMRSAEDAKHSVVCSPDFPIPSPEFVGGMPFDQHRAVQCPVCSKVFPTEALYQVHQRTHAKEPEVPVNNAATPDPYRCNICGKTFAVPARLTRHYRTHTGEKPFKCDFCDKSFSVKENLSVHRRIHTKERPYKCDVCARAFEHSGKLHRHMRIHTGERPHKCSVCAKTFIQSGQLVIHMRTHTGEKPYVCTVCQKGFTCSKQLKVHSRTHTGEKPYSCEICGKSFGYNHVLKLHQVAHYGEKVYKCTICNDTFNSKKAMEAHIKSHSESPAPAQSPVLPTPSESSCSSTSDKENKDSFTNLVPEQFEAPAMSYETDIRYLIYRGERFSPPLSNYLQVGSHPSSGVDLLAAAAAATSSHLDEHLLRNSPETVLNLISKSTTSDVSLRPSYFSSPLQYNPPITAGDDMRKRVEAVLAVEEIQEAERLTPPESPLSNPSSPDPELSLPPRKRSKMILKSMETAKKDVSPVRYSSVIQYARAS